MDKNRKKWLSTFVGTNTRSMCAKFQKIQKKTEGDRFLRKWANLPIFGPMGKKWLSTFVGTNPGNMCAKFQKIQKKTEGGDSFLRKWANLHILAHCRAYGKKMQKVI